MSMALATGDDASGPNSGAETGPKKSHEVNPPNFLDEGGEGSGMRAGHSLHETAIKNGRLVDPLPFGLPLKAVLTVMIGAGEQCISEEHMTGGFLPAIVLSMAHVSGWNAFIMCVLLA